MWSKKNGHGGEHDRKGFIWETAVEQSRGLEGLVGLLRHNCKHQQTTALRVVPTRAYQGTFRGFPNRSIHVSTIYLHSAPFSIIPAFSFALSLQISLKKLGNKPAIYSHFESLTLPKLQTPIGPL